MTRCFVSEISDELHQTKCENPNTSTRGGHECGQEETVVSFPDAVVQPFAMMIKPGYTFIARTAVLGTERPEKISKKTEITNENLK